MRYLLDLADIAGAMSIEGMQGSESPFREGYTQFVLLKVTLKLQRACVAFAGSENMASHTDCDRVQTLTHCVVFHKFMVHHVTRTTIKRAC